MSEVVMSMEDLLNSSVDQLADLKEFKPLPEGSYICIFDWAKNESPAGVKFTLTVKEVVELANPTEENIAEANAPDAKETILFIFNTKDGKANSMGQGELKNIVNEVFQETFGGETLAETLDNAKGAEIRVVLGHRTSTKDGETKVFPKLKSFELA